MPGNKTIAMMSLAAFVLPGVAYAQTVGDQHQFEQVIVTANKRAESIQSAPAAIVALSSEDLAQNNIVSLSQLQSTLTGVQIFNNSNSGTIAVRGVSQSLSEDSATPAVGYNVNGVSIPRESNISSYFDIERIELLPGPQGTLYGGSSAGGVINVITKRPSDVFGGQVTAETGEANLIHVSGAVDLPVSSTFSLRPAVDYNKHDGYISNGTNDLDAFSGRLSGQWKPNDAFSLLVVGAYYHDQGLGVNSIVRPGTTRGLTPAQVHEVNGDTTDPFKSSRSTAGYFNHKETYLLTVEAKYDFGPVTLTNVGGYSKFNIHNVGDGGVAIRDVAFDGYSASDELRLSNTNSDRWNWLIGLYGFQNISDATQINIFPASILHGARRPSTIHSDKKGYAVFGQSTYSFTDTTRVTFGGRYSWDDVSGSGTTVLPPTPLNATNSYSAGISNSTWDWKIGLEHDFAKDWLVYATVQSGYLPGGFNTITSNTSSSISRVFQPESLISYTVGSKSRFFNNRVTLNTEFFYYDYQNYQQREINVSSGRTVSITYNAPSARIYGNQTDLRVLLTDNDVLTFSETAMSAEFTKFSIPVVGNFAGYEMPYAPSLTTIVGYSHTFELGDAGSLTAGVRSRYNSGFWGTYKHLSGTKQDHYTSTEVSLTYRTSDDRWEAVAYADNLENEAVYNGMQAIQIGPIYWVSAVVGRPRIFGFRVTRRF